MPIVDQQFEAAFEALEAVDNMEVEASLDELYATLTNGHGAASNYLRSESDSSRSSSEASDTSASTMSSSSDDVMVVYPPPNRKSTETLSGKYKCAVCGERAGKHIYYGGRVCPSCR